MRILKTEQWLPESKGQGKQRVRQAKGINLKTVTTASASALKCELVGERPHQHRSIIPYKSVCEISWIGILVTE